MVSHFWHSHNFMLPFILTIKAVSACWNFMMKNFFEFFVLHRFKKYSKYIHVLIMSILFLKSQTCDEILISCSLNNFDGINSANFNSLPPTVQWLLEYAFHMRLFGIRIERVMTLHNEGWLVANSNTKLPKLIILILTDAKKIESKLF